jgi:asparagine N-glycosylation enzyme membrane subunit Stt3
MVAGDKVFHSGNQGFAELVPLAGLPLGIIAMYYAVKGIKGSKPGIAVAGLVLSIIAIMLCFAVVVAMPGPMQPLLGM